MSRMFKSITKTWNPQVGCLYECVYCWARELAETKLKDVPRYKNGFRPLFISNELRKRFQPGWFVFVTDMGDLFGYWVPLETIRSVLRCIARWPETTFLLQTKNPGRFLEVREDLPVNVYLGTTIETDSYLHGRVFDSIGAHKVTDAPVPFQRYMAISDPMLEPWRKFISIEPIMDFDCTSMCSWMSQIRPSIIEVGADNYGHNLREPPWDKVQTLLSELRKICPVVKEKTGLERLREASAC